MDDSAARKCSRTTIINIRVTDAEKRQIADQADKSRLSVSAYLRRAAFVGKTAQARGQSVSAAERRQIALILAHLGFIMDRIRGEDASPFLDELELHLKAVRDECFTALGKRP